MKEDVKEQIILWQELRQCYKEEIEMLNNIELNEFLLNNATDEIDKLHKDSESIKL